MRYGETPPFILVIGAIASLITIFAFVTGIVSLPRLLNPSEENKNRGVDPLAYQGSSVVQENSRPETPSRPWENEAVMRGKVAIPHF